MSNPQSEYIERQKRECQERWFKDHKANKVDAADCILINWANPQSWNYGCRFIIHRRWLCVVGDIGEAVYEWGNDITLDFLAGLDFGYFHGKCQASPEGRKFEDWDSQVANTTRLERLKELLDQQEQGCHEYIELSLLDNLAGKEEYAEAAKEVYDRSGDAETASDISDMGIVPSVHAIGMFVGLQMAIKQLTHPEVKV